MTPTSKTLLVRLVYYAKYSQIGGYLAYWEPHFTAISDVDETFWAQVRRILKRRGLEMVPDDLGVRVVPVGHELGYAK